RLYTKGNKPLDIEPKQICELRVAIHALNIITVWNPDNTGRQNIAFRFTDILFPEETITTKNLASITIYTVPNFYEHLDKDAINIDWIAYADDMTPKKGTFEVISLLMDILPNK
ncbi:MAG: hypothetical protein JXB38_20195, partial [Anaerolineales bacterium]|nr:hypothetical protein [Anaerolineales bacterium]